MALMAQATTLLNDSQTLLVEFGRQEEGKKLMIEVTFFLKKTSFFGAVRLYTPIYAEGLDRSGVASKASR